MSEAAVLPPRANAEAGFGGSILIIDDEAAIRESLETLLEFEGYNVESAGTAAEGLARLTERNFDLVHCGLLHQSCHVFEKCLYTLLHELEAGPSCLKYLLPWDNRQLLY